MTLRAGRRRIRLGAAIALSLLGACSSDATTVVGPDATATSTTSTTTSTSTTRAATTTSAATSATSTSAATTSTTTSTIAATTTSAAPHARPATIDELLALGRPIVLAHTGGEDEFPGSTMFAFTQSVRAGVDVLDLNVLQTEDGVLVVQHDDTVDRTTEATGPVADLTYDELAALDNAHWFTAACTCPGRPDAEYVYRGVRTGAVPPPAGFTADDFAVPRLSDLIARFPDALLNLEIKGEGEVGAQAARALAAELAALGRSAASVVSSFDDTVVAAFHEAAPDVEISPGLQASAAWVLEGTPLPDGMTILQLPPKFGDIQVIDADTIARSRAAGYRIWLWPNDRSLENESSYRQFLADGIDGLNINFPAAGVAAVAALVATT